ncbi:MAG TPA: hypothetical protein VNM39_10995 [Verrucomicrobiae bacterium]|nr:hypothetical protein [Verrucomicrobiae bacterium]
MSFRSQRWLPAALLMLALLTVCALPAHAANTITLPRSGQVGIGITGSFGTLLPTGELGNEFGSGPGLSVKIRYRMRFERAIGLTFDAERMNSRDPSGAAGAFDSLTDAPAVLRDYMKMVTAGFEFYQLFDTRERTVKYLSAGAGLAQISAHLTDGETQYPIAGDALFVSVGAGFERFFFRSWAWEMAFKYKPVLHDGKINHDLQGNVGLIFYAGY